MFFRFGKLSLFRFLIRVWEIKVVVVDWLGVLVCRRFILVDIMYFDFYSVYFKSGRYGFCFLEEKIEVSRGETIGLG